MHVGWQGSRTERADPAEVTSGGGRRAVGRRGHHRGIREEEKPPFQTEVRWLEVIHVLLILNCSMRGEAEILSMFNFPRELYEGFACRMQKCKKKYNLLYYLLQ